MTKKKHCKTCYCDRIARPTPMHRKHTFDKDPSYINVERGARTAVFLCERSKTMGQHCWVTKEEVLNA